MAMVQGIDPRISAMVRQRVAGQGPDPEHGADVAARRSPLPAPVLALVLEGWVPVAAEVPSRGLPLRHGPAAPSKAPSLPIEPATVSFGWKG